MISVTTRKTGSKSVMCCLAQQPSTIHNQLLDAGYTFFHLHSEALVNGIHPGWHVLSNQVQYVTQCLNGAELSFLDIICIKKHF